LHGLRVCSVRYRALLAHLVAVERAQVGLDGVHLGTRSTQLDRDGPDLIWIAPEFAPGITVPGLEKLHSNEPAIL
jgi:hypothetical protein